MIEYEGLAIAYVSLPNVLVRMTSSLPADSLSCEMLVMPLAPQQPSKNLKRAVLKIVSKIGRKSARVVFLKFEANFLLDLLRKLSVGCEAVSCSQP